MRTQVVIIGGGPAGLLLACKLFKNGIDFVLIEQRTREYVLSRIRAGVLESGTVNQLVEVGVGDRLKAEGQTHDGVYISTSDGFFHVDFKKLVNKTITVYGQTEITRDMYDALESWGANLIFEAKGVDLTDFTSDSPKVFYQKDGVTHEIQSDLVIGCDGFHGISKSKLSGDSDGGFSAQLPIGWLGILSETPPLKDELVYSRSDRGFALASMRSQSLSRYYIQVALSDLPENWSDDAFWHELKHRFPAGLVENLVMGPSIEKSIAPLRTYVSKSMGKGRLLLCGDAAHIVPPTGAKGLNLAASDVHYAFEAISGFFRDNDQTGLKKYSTKALLRVWKSMRFSWWMTQMFHTFPDRNPFEEKIMASELSHLRDSVAMQKVFSENYTGLPY
ncbi:MAG: 4-hydroxybenzoate 3-monooxygenase [Rhodobacteraceae bacterium]|nr:4-hydroxybenzoate 3-monooxygenase [Paracoccaceae bacterium]